MYCMSRSADYSPQAIMSHSLSLYLTFTGTQPYVFVPCVYGCFPTTMLHMGHPRHCQEDTLVTPGTGRLRRQPRTQPTAVPHCQPCQWNGTLQQGAFKWLHPQLICDTKCPAEPSQKWLTHRFYEHNGWLFYAFEQKCWWSVLPVHMVSTVSYIKNVCMHVCKYMGV